MDNSLLGPYKWKQKGFPQLAATLELFDNQEFKENSQQIRLKIVNRTLLDLIRKEPLESFLLPAVLEYISEINKRNILSEKLNLSLFEFWLNHFSGITEKENYLIRGKINGKWIPREEYQQFFPIGMNKTYEGTHFVAAHLSPDLDTTIASLFGWLDAFSARVGNRLHIWALPGGPPDSPTTRVVQEIFGENIFDDCARKSISISLTAIDLVSQHNLAQLEGDASTNEIDHGTGEKAVMLVDKQGNYQGNWRSSDVEVVMQVTVLYKAALDFFGQAFSRRLISLLAKPSLTLTEWQKELNTFFRLRFEDCGPFTHKQKKLLDPFLKNVLKLPGGIQSTLSDLPQIKAVVDEILNGSIFDKTGALREDRTILFPWLEKNMQHFEKAMHDLRLVTERLDIAMKVKREVLGHQTTFVNLHSDIDDIRLKIKHFDYIPVVFSESNKKLFPIGVIWASLLNKPILGTVTFRDFCNLDEINMSSYLSVISVIDHHKTNLQTTTTPLAIVGDAQSSNVLIAEKSFLINDRYSSGGLEKEEIELGIKEAYSLNKTHVLQRLLQRKEAQERQEGYFVHPDREYAEYLCYLHAILDDTDLLSKVTNRDVECVANLLNRLQSLIQEREVESIRLTDIPKDENFATAAAKKILKNPDMYAFYAKTYEYKERDVEKQMESGDIFQDTKEQNGCCRIGQTKLFSSNFPLFYEKRDSLREHWVRQAVEKHTANTSIDLHIHMISTIANAREVFEDQTKAYRHRDEMWFWIPQNSQAYAHLATFLSAFQFAKEVARNKMSLEVQGPYSSELQEIFSQNLKLVSSEAKEGQKAIAILYFDAGTINSRKSMVTPYLPRLVG